MGAQSVTSSVMGQQTGTNYGSNKMTMDPAKGMLKEIHLSLGKLFFLFSPLHAQMFSG